MFCTPSAVPPIVRSEGIAERTGDILLDCASGTPGAIVKGNLTVFLNVSVTNKLLANNTTDVLLTVDTGAGPVPANVAAQPYAPNAVVFNGLSFTVPPSGRVGLRITNLRANASQLGPTPQLPIFALLSFNEGSALVTTNSQFTVAVTEPGLLTSFSSTGVRCAGSPLPSTINLTNLFARGTIFFSTRATEGFATAFEPKNTFSDTGTRIMVRYSGFPAAARLFVPDFVAGSDAVTPTAGGDLGVAASGGQYMPGATGSLLLVRVVGADANGAGGTLAFPPPGPGVTTFDSASEVTLASGAGNAVYEVVDANPNVRESVQFPTFLGLAPLGNGSPAVADMAVSFAPLSTIGVIAAAPIPRFADVLPQSDCAAEGDCNAGYFPKLNVESPALNFSAPAFAFLQTQYVRVHNDGGGAMPWTATVSYQNGTGWLTADPPSGVGNATVRVDAHPDKVPPGTYQGTVTIDAGPFAGSRSIPVTFTVTSGPGPAAGGPSVTSILNAATLQAGALAPGSLATLMGSGLAGSAVEVTFNGVPGKLLYTSATQLNLQLPAALAGKTSVQAVVTVDGQTSTPTTVTLAAVAPAIFSNGILNQNYSVNSSAKPAAPGSVIQIFATGLASPGSGAITARIANRDVLAPYYAGPAPGIPGVQQVNILLPADLPAGAAQVEVCAIGSDPTQRICSMPASVVLK
jgi:uncharacterized protein (TIGR03437 family)